MIADLPEPTHAPLPSAPLELVVWQLQFAGAAAVQDPAVGTRMAEALAADGSGPFQLTRVASQIIALAGLVPGQQMPPAEQPEPDGWQLRRGQLVVNVNRGSATVETTDYEDWAGFRRTVELVCKALEDIPDLPGEQRLGLRYVDRIALPGVRRPTDWRGLLASWLAAPMAHEHLGDAVVAVAGQLELRVDDEAQATIRHRAFPDFERRGRQTAMLDYDIYRQGYRVVEADAVLDASDRFNDVIHRLFEASITTDLRAVFAREDETTE
jgi:uncharacterized protein (TIGR04255 family)